MKEKKQAKINQKIVLLTIVAIVLLIAILTAVVSKTNREGKNTHFLLYEGCEIEKKIGEQNIYDYMIDIKEDEANEKYNTMYYNYEKGGFINSTKGTFKYENGGYQNVDNVGRVAISKNYNAIPRKYEKVNEVPEKLQDLMDYSILEIEKIDLDGDGKQEYLICTGVSYKAGQIGDGEPVASSTISLYDSEFNKVADLVDLKDGFTSVDKKEDEAAFLTLNNVIYFDMDNDGIMEIIAEIPMYEEKAVGIFRYSNNKLEGETIIVDSILP